MPEVQTASWESVLAQCEATAAHAQALLDSRRSIDPDELAGLMDLDLWKLSLTTLPPELFDRARAVHSQSIALQQRLIASMRVVHQQLQLISATEEAQATPRFLDLSA